jgi:hypothetical protein
MAFYLFCLEEATESFRQISTKKMSEQGASQLKGNSFRVLVGVGIHLETPVLLYHI